MGPHTSNWDFIIGRLAFSHFGVKGKFLIKKEAFFFPFGYILKAMGGIPVNRGKSTNLIDQAVQYFDESEELYMVFTPEGTREYSPEWKIGFYYIAQKANVPIYIGYMDYEKKIGGFHRKVFTDFCRTYQLLYCSCRDSVYSPIYNNSLVLNGIFQ
jgi:1-acyl-sn-glycerol-3-phosphate acyltransferase